MVDVVKTLRLEDGGTIKAHTESAKALGKELDNAAVKAAKVGKAAGAAKDVSAANKAESRAYDNSRAAVGTGAAGRDFANQAQGLGGLVRVYATFAANIFAVSAAFRALSTAADTTNLVEGLNQLGAASGRNLGTLAKQIVSVTDGAVSMREAMTATAQTTAAGLSSIDVLRVAKGAKQASQALGIDMSDALSRLSRGITKLEPELLDELGIFVRVDKASQEYAKSIGKSALSLTDFEKRAAFANAVLGQVEKKFGDIKIPANPYTQLLASLKNVSQAGLELVNKVLGPIAEMLAKSPAGLAIGLAGISTMLISQAIPALTSFRANLRAAATEAAEKAKETKEAFAMYKESNYSQLQDKLSKGLKAEGAAVAHSLEVAKTAVSSKILSNFGVIKDIKKGPLEDTSKANIDRLRNTILEQENKLKTTSNKLSDEENAKLTTKIQQLKMVEALVTKAVASNASYKLKEDAEMLANGRKSGSTVQESLLARISDKAAKAELKGTMLANAADNAALLGVSDSWKSLNAEIDKNKDKLNGWDKLSTRVRGGLSIISTAAMTAISAFSTWAIIIGVVVSAVTLLISWGKKNTEQIEASNASLNTLTESYKTVGRVVELTNKMDPFEKLSATAIKARATSIEELAISIKTAYESVEKEISARNGVDEATNFISKLWNGDSETKLAKEVSAGLANAIDLAKRSPEMQNALKDLLSLTNGKTSKTDILTILTKNADKLPEGIKLIGEIGKEAKKTSAEVSSLAEAFDSAAKASSELSASLNTTDPVAQLGIKSAKAAIEMAKAFKNPIAAAEELRKILSDPVKLSLFGAGDVQNLIKIGVELESLEIAYKSATDRVIELNAEKDKLNKQPLPKINANSLDENTGAAGVLGKSFTSDAIKLTKRLEELPKAIAAAQAQAQNIQTKIEANISATRNAAINQFIKGAEQIQNSIAQGYAKAGISLARAYNQAAPDTIGGILKETQLANKEVDLQMEGIKVNISLIKSQELLRIAVIEDTLDRRKARLADRKPGTTLYDAEDASIKREEKDVSFLKSQLNSRTPLIDLINKTKTVRGDPNLTKEEKNASLERISGSLTTSSALANQGSQMAQAAAKKQENKLSEQYKLIDRDYAEQAKSADSRANDLAVAKSKLDAKYAAKAFTEEEYAIQTAAQERLKVISDNEKRMSDLFKEQDKIALQLATNPSDKLVQSKQSENFDRQVYESKEGQKRLATQDIGSGVSIAKAKATDVLESQKLIDTAKFNSDADNLNTAIALNAQEQGIIDKLNSQNLLTVDGYAKKNELLGLARLDLENAKEKLGVEKEHKTAADELTTILVGQYKAGASPELMEQTIAKLDILDQEKARRIALLDLGTKTAKDTITLTDTMTERTKSFNSYFEGAVGSMSDALVDFGLTGKQNFGEMINSMIVDLAKLELRMMFTNSLKGANGLTGLVKSVASFFGFANGGSFNSGIQKFAKGGTFTNSVVASPTLFKFAKGTGMMGEAGPEAIMPLKRDSNGTLGVRANINSEGPTTTVVVYNYGKEEAKTKESVDSRGNRKIELTIGEMVAGEISRPGSAAQSSIRSTFGSRPQLIRR